MTDAELSGHAPSTKLPNQETDMRDTIWQAMGQESITYCAAEGISPQKDGGSGG
jgi:hypothetical protein